MLEMTALFENILIYFTCFTSLLITIFFIRANNVLTIILLNASFSLFAVVMYLTLDAPDVAMTEASVGVLTSIFAIYTIKVRKSYSFKESLNLPILGGCLLLAICLIYAGTELSEFGDFNNSPYINLTPKDINIPSVVTAILASYRGYDTLFETIVIIIAGMAILLVGDIKITNIINKEDLLITSITRFMIPFIFLFALYLQFHGEISPGGGFQAGVIIALAFIIYNMVLGKSFSLSKLRFIAILGLGIYFITGIISFFKEGEFLNYNILHKNNLLAQKMGIISVEIGIGISVAAIMLLIYICLSQHAVHKSEL